MYSALFSHICMHQELEQRSVTYLDDRMLTYADVCPGRLHQELEQLSATYLDDRVSRTQFRTAMLARDLREEHTAQVCMLTYADVC